MDKIDIILKERANRVYRDDWPFENYYEKTERTDKLLEEIEKKIKSRHCIQEARKQFITAYITAFEVYFKDRLLTVLKTLGNERFLEEVKIKIDLEELKRVLENKITLNDFIVYSFNFQDLDQINKAFSVAFELPFFEELKKGSFKILNSKLPPLKIHKNFYSELKKFINLRHDFVHDINFNKNISRYELDRYSIIYSRFILCVDMFVEDKIAEKFKNRNSKK